MKPRIPFLWGHDFKEKTVGQSINFLIGNIKFPNIIYLASVTSAFFKTTVTDSHAKICGIVFESTDKHPSPTILWIWGRGCMEGKWWERRKAHTKRWGKLQIKAKKRRTEDVMTAEKMQEVGVNTADFVLMSLCFFIMWNCLRHTVQWDKKMNNYQLWELQ